MTGFHLAPGYVHRYLGLISAGFFPRDSAREAGDKTSWQHPRGHSLLLRAGREFWPPAWSPLSAATATATVPAGVDESPDFLPSLCWRLPSSQPWGGGATRCFCGVQLEERRLRRGSFPGLSLRRIRLSWRLALLAFQAASCLSSKSGISGAKRKHRKLTTRSLLKSRGPYLVRLLTIFQSRPVFVCRGFQGFRCSQQMESGKAHLLHLSGNRSPLGSL